MCVFVCAYTYIYTYVYIYIYVDIQVQLSLSLVLLNTTAAEKGPVLLMNRVAMMLAQSCLAYRCMHM